MPTLIKRPGSKFWFAAFDVPQPDGTMRRLKKSTKKTKRADAMAEAVRLEDLERSAHGSTGANASQAYAILAEAAAAAAKGELSEARARELISRLCEVSNGEALKFHTVRSWAADWLASKAATGKKATIARYKAHIETFLVWLGDKADGKLETVTKADARAFRDAIRAGWSEDSGKTATKPGKAGKGKPSLRTAKTTNHYAADVAGLFRAAMREGLLLANPCAALERLPEDDSNEREVFTVAEVSQLVNEAGNASWQDRVIRHSSSRLHLLFDFLTEFR